MNRTQGTFWSVILLAVIGAWTLLKAPEPETAPANPANTRTPNSGLNEDHIQITIASSVTKQSWMEAAVEKFHESKARTASGKLIRVSVHGRLSGGSMWEILDGKLKPTVWSPGAVSWTEQFSQRWSQSGHGQAMSALCQPTIYSPIGFAMWRPMAEALGWPDKPVGWRTIVDLASDPQGWARYAHPEWGRLKLGHPHPKYSSAGMLFLASLAYGVTGKTAGLSVTDVYSPEFQTAMRQLAQNTTKYGMISTDLLRMMAEHGPNFLHAVSAFEEGAVRLNLERASQLRWPLVFIFPTEGTFWSSHPYCILDGTDWVNEEQAESARYFLDYLRSLDRQIIAVDHLLRPLDAEIEIRAPLSTVNGTDPGVRLDTIPALQAPDAAITDAIIDQFLITKRKASMYVMLDVSESMSGEKMRSSIAATAEFLKRLHPNDQVRVGLFNDRITWLDEATLVSSNVEQLIQGVNNIYAGGGTALFDAVCQSMRGIRTQQQLDRDAGRPRLYGVVLLSDGDNTNGVTTENQMFANCLPRNAEAGGVKIFPIAFGTDANVTLLTRIASVSGGRVYNADSDSVERAYLRISAEQ